MTAAQVMNPAPWSLLLDGRGVTVLDAEQKSIAFVPHADVSRLDLWSRIVSAVNACRPTLIATTQVQAGLDAPIFTPGPWHASPTRLANAFDIGANCGANIALVYGPTENGADEFRANARLIAAAPDLYDALKIARECVAYCRRNHADVQSGEGIPAEVFIDAALAKAVRK